jgi:hypothetical protein
MDKQEKDQIAHDRYGKPFTECTTNEKKGVGGVHGGQIGARVSSRRAHGQCDGFNLRSVADWPVAA